MEPSPFSRFPRSERPFGTFGEQPPSHPAPTAWTDFGSFRMSQASGAGRVMPAHTPHVNHDVQSLPRSAPASALALTQPDMPTLRSRNELLITGVMPVPPMPDSNCSICTEPLASDVVKMVACGHAHHCVRVLSWFLGNGHSNRRCCNCREPLNDADPAPFRPAFRTTEAEPDQWPLIRMGEDWSITTGSTPRPAYPSRLSIHPRRRDNGVDPLQNPFVFRTNRLRSFGGPPEIYNPTLSAGQFSGPHLSNMHFPRPAHEMNVEESQNSDAQTPSILTRRPPRGPPMNVRGPPTRNLTPLEMSISRLNPLETSNALSRAPRLSVEDNDTSRRSGGRPRAIHPLEGFRSSIEELSRTSMFRAAAPVAPGRRLRMSYSRPAPPRTILCAPTPVYTSEFYELHLSEWP
ncbi:hypothetical protein HBH70_092470 [Parastagonospora nodorum]|nr:hypothetical protein HBH53_060460 [Parastagonospora nodorum]KAH3975503.1 hypothetical protein HBH52_126390 [Parastagonospora nodorum]KAH3998894.1 hypothetical protein HBI10_119950 [Parastagonospora nodorum]KAH4025084.1 hypothetical protein HBI13_077240 [Parastagonospora nodorum]KAH4049299.1 hypothetical protein HBH49_144810 [Parastagonospora nodorum]